MGQYPQGAPGAQYPQSGVATAASGAAKKSWPAALVTIIGGAAMAAGVFLPWIRTDLQSGITGWALFSNAKAVLGAAVVALLLGLVMLVKVRSIVVKLLLVAAGGVGIGVSVYELLKGPDQVNKVGLERVPSTNLNAAFGAGVVVCAAGGALVLLSGLFSRMRNQPKSG